MKIKLLFIGKESADIFQPAVQQYLDKLKFYVSVEVVALPYLKNSKSMSYDEQKGREGELLLKKIEPQDEVVLLDERGKEMTSMAFSKFLQQKMNGGRNVVFVIGGAYGFSPAVYARANAQLSLSKLTFPHIMTRLIFLEQLYRACTILRGEPYHHE